MLSSILSASIFLAGAVRAVEYSTTRHISQYSPLETPLLPPASFSSPMVSRTSRRASKAHALHYLRASGISAHTVPLTGAQFDYEYLTDISVGGQNLSVIVDTGSSDTWFPEMGFACFNLSGHPEPVSTCAFGSEGFDSRISNSYQAYPNTTFSISYGDGEYLSGSAAFETVSVGGLTVKHQEIGVVSSAAWVGDGINSGLLGLAYPELTSVTNDIDHQDMKYNPFFFNAVKQKLVPYPYFSIALNRGTAAGTHSPAADPHLGYLAFGGIAPVPVTSTCTTVPIQGYSLTTRAPTADRHSTYMYYTVDIHKYTFPNSSTVVTASNSTIIDSGTTLNLLPSEVAQAYNKGFGTWHDGLYYVDCAAQAPPFSVTLGGKTFSTDPQDQVVWVGTDKNGNDLCVSGTQDGGPQMMGSVFILGDVFMHNVVVTFDIQKNQMTFTQRKSCFHSIYVYHIRDNHPNSDNNPTYQTHRAYIPCASEHTSHPAE
ncbi:Acid protease [Mycena venus]|uniref:Acid protease n=1 Tax=Mycena venus TaxID=2733690 RepID=A0A8H6X213_9AGAR|nr:Acid protease [Mycena venus]